MPTVSCVMVTKGNLFPTRLAVDCFLRQTHADRELVVVCDREAAELKRYIAGLASPLLRFIEAAPADLGTLRNLSIAEARGELICQWDDDDLYHPRRIEAMLEELARARADAVFLHRWTLWWPNRATLALAGRRVWEGSMLARREVLPPYPVASRAEDSALVRTIRESHRIKLVDDPSLYCYVFHGSNTWPEQHFRSILSRATDVLTGEAYEARLDAMAEHMPVRDYAAGLTPA
ncbi:glycosyltransferase family 2 protein [Falsiroseomonas sp.]|uniref:glycosyltransferase family 2 protein n=1 Tax=Falsiroseomonas sp. TaxID=2870721 RepID=UPI003561CC8B